jgi:CubicO group peptidase (beta-lactamase class C family)
LRTHGNQITIRELMHDTSGLIDDNDIWNATPRELRADLARVGDPKLRAQLLATAARLRANPNATWISPLVFIRLAAWQPLVALPGTTYHHSNIGWNIAGLIAAKAGGKPLPVLYRERLFEPLRLQHTAFSPQGPIAGLHAHGYARVDDRLVDKTSIHLAKFADGAIVTNAQDEATFLRAAMNGALFENQSWLDLYGTPINQAGCGSPAYTGEGSGDGYHSYVWFDSSSKQIAVLLLNKDHVDGAAAARRLYCGA